MADTMPAGYEVYESIGGQVFLRRKTAQVISEAEFEIVRQALISLAEGWCYKAEIKKNMIVIHEASQGHFVDRVPRAEARSGGTEGGRHPKGTLHGGATVHPGGSNQEALCRRALLLPWFG